MIFPLYYLLNFLINVSDNNSFGASIITSEMFIGKYPTLEDLFLEMEEYEDNINIEEELESITDPKIIDKSIHSNNKLNTSSIEICDSTC